MTHDRAAAFEMAEAKLERAAIALAEAIAHDPDGGSIELAETDLQDAAVEYAAVAAIQEAS